MNVYQRSYDFKETGDIYGSPLIQTITPVNIMTTLYEFRMGQHSLTSIDHWDNWDD